MHSFPTSPNARNHTTVLNANVPNSLHNAVIITIRLLTFASQFDRGAAGCNRFVELNMHVCVYMKKPGSMKYDPKMLSVPPYTGKPVTAMWQ